MRAQWSFCQGAQSLQGLFLLLGGQEVFWCANFLLSAHSFKDTELDLWIPTAARKNRKTLRKVVQVIAKEAKRQRCQQTEL